MSDYARQDDFGARDLLPSGDANKVIYGADVDAELDAILTAVNSKSDVAATVAAMKADTSLTAGSLVQTRGYTTSNDDGGGLYLIQAASDYTGSPDGYKDHSLNNGNIAVLQTLGLLNVRQCGVVADNSTDDSVAFQAAIDAAIDEDYTLNIPSGTYYFASQLTFSSRVDVRSDKTALMRWDGIAANVGILLDFEDSGADQLLSIELPCLYGPAISSAFSLTGYGSGTQDPTTRVGTGVHLKGGNRLNVYVHILNGFETGFKAEGTATLSCDNLNLDINTSDYCEKCIEVVPSGNGVSQTVATINTVWAKFPIYIDSDAGYINGCSFNVTGTAFVNEDGGCGVYFTGTAATSSTFRINQLQAGARSDSRNDVAQMLTPSGTMSATPVEGETITQATSGATGVVVTNADYTLGTTLPFTVKTVSGTFDTTNTLTGSTSGALGAGSVPDSVRGLVCPWVGGDQASNGVTYDAEQMGEIGYAGCKHCHFEIGAPMNHPSSATDGAFSVHPEPGETVRIRDNGLHNVFRILNATHEADEPPVTPVALSTTTGEANFGGGVGAAKFSDIVYCSATMPSTADGSAQNFFFYHCALTDGDTDLCPVELIPKNEGFVTNGLSGIAFASSSSENRRVVVRINNNSGGVSTATVYFYLRVNG